MYEKMLDKSVEPSFEDMLRYSGKTAPLWLEIEQFLCESYNLEKLIRFPYGKDYGWGVKYSHGKKFICDIFAEDGAFMAFFKLSNNDIEFLKKDLSDYAKSACDKKYPCGDGGWLRYRVTSSEHLRCLKLMLTAKVKPKI